MAAIGTTVLSWNNGIGEDFALIKIDPAFKVVPGVAGAPGPTGVFCGDPNLIGPSYTLVTLDGRHVGCGGLIGI